MSSPFQKAFSAKSPLYNHGEVRKELRKAKNENEQDYSMERVSKLEEEFKNAKEAHKTSKGDPEAKEKDRLDQNSQDANMPSPGNMLKKKTKVSPLNSYANPGGEIYLSDQPSFQKLQSDIQGAADKVMDAVSGNKNATKKKADAGLVTSGKMSQTEFDNIYGKKTKANA